MDEIIGLILSLCATYVWSYICLAFYKHVDIKIMAASITILSICASLLLLSLEKVL